MNRTYHTLSIVHAALAAVALVIVPPASWADDHDDEEKIPYDEAEIFFELNNTDGDLGIHALIDGDAWKRLRIKDPMERKLLSIKVSGRLRRQGLTELFFESAEPVFEDLAPADFFDRFPPGFYKIEGMTLEGEELESETEVTHLMPAPPGGIFVNTTSIDPAEVDCDDGPIPIVTGAVTITWEPVTMSHPDPDGGGAGVQPQESVEINNYQVVVEVETKSGQEIELSVILPPDITSLPVPEVFTVLDDDGQIKFEILAREDSFNQTAVESCFVLVVP